VRQRWAALTAANARNSAVPAELPGRTRTGGIAALLARIITALLALAVTVAGFMFSMVLLVAGLVAGTAVFLWIWWKMRRALRQADAHASGTSGARDPAARGTCTVIEGEVLSGEWKEPQKPGNPAP
jgi:hypothetical protein